MNCKKTCIFCGADLRGRSDKKYCDDNCRNNHYYVLKKENLSLIKNVNDALMHNRSVLKLLYKNKNTPIDKCMFLQYGFSFELFTNVYRTRKNDEYKVVYDYAYKFVNDNELVVIKYREK